MDDVKRRAAMAERLTAAGAAHGEYEKNALNGEYDEQWAEWYAAFLIGHQWNDLFSNGWNESELADALRQANTAHRADAPSTHWQDFYSEKFAGRA
jgi:hypothetical protein